MFNTLSYGLKYLARQLYTESQDAIEGQPPSGSTHPIRTGE